MKFQDAVSLIKHPSIIGQEISCWADLGSGNGLFSKALASLLQPLSTVYAIDKTPGIEDGQTATNVNIISRKNDFITDQLQLPILDGILMANSLHFVKDKPRFINHISNRLKSNGHFIIVEYDSAMSNRWVPYPLPFSAVPDLFRQSGFRLINLISKVPSVYRDADIYGCIISR